MRNLIISLIVFFLNIHIANAQKFGFEILDSAWLVSFPYKMMNLDNEEFKVNYVYYNHLVDSAILEIEKDVQSSKFKLIEYDRITDKTYQYDYRNYLEYVERRLTCATCYTNTVKDNFDFIEPRTQSRSVFRQLLTFEKYVNEDMIVTDKNGYIAYYVAIQDSINQLEPVERLGALLCFNEIAMEQIDLSNEYEWPREFYFLRPNKQYMLTHNYINFTDIANSITDFEEKVEAIIKISKFYFKYDDAISALRVLFEASSLKELRTAKYSHLRVKLISNLVKVLESIDASGSISIPIMFKELSYSGILSKGLNFFSGEDKFTDDDIDLIKNCHMILLSRDFDLTEREAVFMNLMLKFGLIYTYYQDFDDESGLDIMSVLSAMCRIREFKFPFEKSIFFENRIFQNCKSKDGDLSQVLEDFCNLLILRNDWQKVDDILNKYAYEFKSIGALPNLFTNLIELAQSQELIDDQGGFKKFMETLHSIAHEKQIKKTNETAFVANCYKLMSTYYRNKKPFTPNLVDSVTRYGYYYYQFNSKAHQDIAGYLSYLYWSADSVVSLQKETDSLNAENTLLTTRRDFLIEENYKIQMEYDKKVADNTFLKNDNGRIKRQNKLLSDSSLILDKRR